MREVLQELLEALTVSGVPGWMILIWIIAIALLFFSAVGWLSAG